MIMTTRFPFFKTALVLGLLSTGAFLGANRLSQTLEQSANCPVSGKVAVAEKSVTLNGPLNSVTAPSCGCCSSNNLGTVSATGTGIVALQTVGLLSTLAAFGSAGAGFARSLRRGGAAVEVA